MYRRNGVHRFYDRVSALEFEQPVLHQGKIAGPRIQCGDPNQIAFPPVQRMVVGQAHARDLISREDPVEACSQRRLAAAAVTAGGNEYRPLHPGSDRHTARLRLR
jgi:hypothetical protein